MKDKNFKRLFLYRFGTNESALFLLALTIAVAGLYTKFNNDLLVIQYEDFDSSFGVRA